MTDGVLRATAGECGKANADRLGNSIFAKVEWPFFVSMKRGKGIQLTEGGIDSWNI